MKKSGKEKIYDALCLLAAGKPLDKVSISSLVAEAGMNRTSFYYHFDSVQAAVDSLIDDFSNQYLDLLWQIPRQAGLGREHWMEAEHQVCAFVNDRKEHIRFILSAPNNLNFKRRFLNCFYSHCHGGQFQVVQVCPDGQTRPLKQGIPYDYYLQVTAYHLLGILEFWAERNFSEEAEDFIQILGTIYSCRIQAHGRTQQAKDD
ncbi:MAG: TetR/AcrR family transcriptional regulator [Oscillibacter sp.]|nr:TetR/AcrR family transcriptional regulator [Oscillibacter sp.]